MKRIISIVILAVLLSGCGPSKNEIIYSQTLTAIPPMIQTQQAPILASGTSIAKLSTQAVGTLEADKSKIKSSKESVEKTYSKFSLNVATLVGEYAILKVTSKSCDNPTNIKFNMTSNSTVSESLKKYVEETDGFVEKADWDIIWNNTNAAIHNVYGEFKHTFVVAFKSSGMFIDDYIFKADTGCKFDLGQ